MSEIDMPIDLRLRAIAIFFFHATFHATFLATFHATFLLRRVKRVLEVAIGLEAVLVFLQFDRSELGYLSHLKQTVEYLVAQGVIGTGTLVRYLSRICGTWPYESYGITINSQRLNFLFLQACGL